MQTTLMLYLCTKLPCQQQWYGLADMQVEYMINDRLSFMRFLGLEIGENIWR